MIKFIFYTAASLLLFGLRGARVNLWMGARCVILVFLGFNFMNLVSSRFFSLGYGMLLDSASFGLVSLSFWVTLLILLASYRVYVNNEQRSLFCVLVVGLLFVLVLTFTIREFLYFYFFFEASLVPTLLIIIGWGYQPERLQAGIYFLFYTLTVSLPLLLSII